MCNQSEMNTQDLTAVNNDFITLHKQQDQGVKGELEKHQQRRIDIDELDKDPGGKAVPDCGFYCDDWTDTGIDSTAIETTNVQVSDARAFAS